MKLIIAVHVKQLKHIILSFTHAGTVNVIRFLGYCSRIHLNGSTRDEEPLVNSAVNRSRGKVLALGDAGKSTLVGTVTRGLDGSVGTVAFN